MSELSEFQKEVGEWADETFKHDDYSLYSLFLHLGKEIKELGIAIADFMGQALQNLKELPNRPKQLDRQKLNNELADCFILLLNIAHICNIDLLDESRKKMERNRKRKWRKPDKDGVIEHV